MQIEDIRERTFFKVLIAMLLGWTLLLAGILFWNIRNLKQSTVQLAEQTARMSWEKDILYRMWGAKHGGVYVPVSQYAVPNPYLKVKNRDVMIGGREYTLINPAFMTRQVYDLAEDMLSIKGHITSLNPIRPKNAADVWEQKALKSFEDGNEEYKEIVEVGDVSYLRLMRPFITQAPCLRCHAEQGYKIGDVRGGISIRVPMDIFQSQYSKYLKQLWGAYIFIWFVGVGFVFMLGSIINQTVEKLSKSQKNMTSILANIDSAGLGVYIVDEKYRIRHMNKTMQSWVDGVVGDSCYKVTQGLQSPCNDCYLHQIVQKGENIHYELKQNNRILDIMATPMVLQDGTVAKMEIRTDITAQRQSEKDLLVAKEAAEAAAVSQSAFLANMSHDIRTPLNGIMGMLRLTLDTDLDESQREKLESAKISTDFLFALLNDILDLSKINADQLILEEHTFSLSVFLADIQSMFSHVAREKDLELNIVLGDEVPDIVQGDSLRIRQVLTNFISNAIKFTHEGGIILTVEASSSGDDDMLFQFTVKDTGIGIADDMLEKVFESFTQADVSITRQYGGTGLGLAICNRLVQLMEGNVEVVSSEGTGSTFSFTVRLKLGNKQDLTELQHKDSEILQLDSCLVVLLVEDNKINRDLARMTLEKMGHSVREAGNGIEALKIMEKQFFDVILMDVQMPIMDGLTATQNIRLCEQGGVSDSDPNYELLAGLQKKITGSQTPIVALTANAMAEDRARCMMAGMDEYLTKPFLPGQVAVVLAQVTGSRIIKDVHLVEPGLDNSSQSSQIEQVSEHLQKKYSLREEQISKLLRVSVTELKDNIDKLKIALADFNTSEMKLLSHTMKGSLLNLGLDESSEIAKVIEFHAAANDDIDYDELILELCASIDDLLSYKD
jgi:signal transduction histidine kinase/DNA-binding response OmpR family regulator